MNNNTKKYTVYENDLKFKQMRNLDPDKIIWANEDVEALSKKDFDTITYRLKQCKQGNWESLDFSRLGLKKFPDLSGYNHFIELSKIKYLFLDNNLLEFCDDTIKYFKNVEILDISFNKITNISYLPPKLKELNCSQNLLRTIENHDMICRLDCSTNIIEKLGMYPNLTDLICFNNKLTQIQRYDKLTRLICNCNPLTSISDQPKLIQLDCSETNLNNNVSDMPNLIMLICNNTKITDISKFQKLETLEMVGCDMKIPYIKSLKTLLCKNYENIPISTKYKIEREITEGNNSCILFKTLQ